MTTSALTNENEKFPSVSFARVTGLFYLLIAFAGAFSIGYMPSVIFAADDMTETIQNMVDNKLLFHMGIAGDIAVILMEVILTSMLYKMFKSVNQTLSLIAAFSRMGMAVVMGINLLNYVLPSVLVNSPEYLQVFQASELENIVSIFLDMHQKAVYVWQLFFGLHLVILGYLIYKSGVFPKIFGTLNMVGSFGYTLQSFKELLFPQFSSLDIGITILLVIVVIGELGFTFYLLIKGMKKAEA
ncbi:MAG: DUF4386 domain-containing protein [Bacteroidetes bacterium]|nr:MAG: DUF4386 domain-containing protein [Bacteroidota bacterium]